SPPPEGSKNEVLKLRSVNTIVNASANTGKDNNNKTAVINADQTNKENFSIVIPYDRTFIIVGIKLITPIIEDAPAKCKEKVAKSTDLPACPSNDAKGGYTVHPAPTPISTIEEINNKNNEGGNNQNLKLFIRGNAISGAPNIKGTNQFPKPPIKIGITIKIFLTKA
ncbi:cytochrome c oxidase subunit I, partial [Trichonephila clavipes]